MYAYFAGSALGWSWVRAVARFITSAQLLQFVLGCL